MLAGGVAALAPGNYLRVAPPVWLTLTDAWRVSGWTGTVVTVHTSVCRNPTPDS